MVDFRRARIRDVGWWRASNALIRSMQREDELEIVRAAYAFQCALVGNSALDDKNFKECQERAQWHFRDLVNRVQPWAAKSAEAARADEMNGLIELYKRTIGDPSDPAFMAELTRQIEADRAGSEAAAESEEARVSRLANEYAADRQRRLDALLKKGAR